MKNDELEAPLVSSENHRIRTLAEKNGETSHPQDGYLIKISESLKKRVGGWENKGNLGTDEMDTLEKT